MRMTSGGYDVSRMNSGLPEEEQETMEQTNPTMEAEMQAKTEPEVSEKLHADVERGSDRKPIPHNAKEGYQRWNRTVRSLGRRSVFVGLFLLLAVYLSATATMRLPIPNAISYAFYPEIYFGILLGLAVLSVLFGGDILWDGVRSLFRGRANFSTLVMLAMVAAIVHSVMQIVHPTGELTYPCVTMAALFVLMRARMAQATASRITYRMAAEHVMATGVFVHAGAEPYLEKRPLNDPQRFVRATAYDAWSSRIERLYTLIVVVAAVALSAIVVAATGDTGRFPFALSAILAAACQLGLLLAVALACRGTAWHLSKNGAAIAGMAATLRMADVSWLRLTEEDLFPTGSIRMDDYIDLRGTLNEREALTYAASVQTDTAIGKVLSEALRERYCAPKQAESIVRYVSGGRRGQVDGKDVLLGTAKCMNEQRIPIPSLPNEEESLFLAVDGVTQAVFEFTYSITNTVHTAMQGLVERQTGVLLEAKDGYLSEERLTELFGVRKGMIRLVERREKDEVSESETTLLAVLTRDNVGAFADCLGAACLLGRLSAAGVILGIAAAALGMLLAAYLCFVFAPLSVSPIRMLVYAVLWLIPICYVENETKNG